ncbi:MAG TPA: DegV family protein [Acidimicrobiales bacterium]|nr:DegV family protein [Acidimicrobiales bacterium]
MPSIHVVTDSACDLSPAVVDERGARVVPLSIRFGSEELVDREELSTKEFWDRVITGPHMPETAAPAPGAFQQAFLEASQAGAESVVCITISSRLSATYQAACTAAEAVAATIPVRVVDSLSVTLGQGLIVLAALEMAEEGRAADDIVAALEDMKARTWVYGVFESLDYLRRGGRIGGAAHLVGSLLSIKPVIVVRDGVVEVESKQRTRARSLQYLAGRAVEAAPLERLAVADGAARDIEEVFGHLQGVDVAHPIVTADLGPVVGSHIGPGSVGVCFTVARR